MPQTTKKTQILAIHYTDAEIILIGYYTDIIRSIQLRLQQASFYQLNRITGEPENITQPFLLLAFRPSAAVYEMPVTYRATPGLGIYTGCLGCLSLVGLLTIGIQTYRTAVMNPVETLRQE